MHTQSIYERILNKLFFSDETSTHCFWDECMIQKFSFMNNWAHRVQLYFFFAQFMEKSKMIKKKKDGDKELENLDDEDAIDDLLDMFWT